PATKKSLAGGGEPFRTHNPQVAAFIDQLTEVADEGIGTHSTAWASGFLGSDAEPRFAGGILGSRKPIASSAMQQLVRLGVAALPDLLEHMSDPRETKLKVGGKRIFGANWHSDEYDPRYRDPLRQPPGVNSRPLAGTNAHVDEYTVR